MKSGDIVKLNDKGREFYRTKAFPHIIGALYSNIISGNAQVISVEDTYIRVRLIDERFPANIEKTNNFGIIKEHVEVADV